VAGIQRYFENELTDEWREGREAAIKVGRLRNHRSGTTERNDMKLPLWVALDFQEQGVMSPLEITEDVSPNPRFTFSGLAILPQG